MEKQSISHQTVKGFWRYIVSSLLHNLFSNVSNVPSVFLISDLGEKKKNFFHKHYSQNYTKKDKWSENVVTAQPIFSC